MRWPAAYRRAAHPNTATTARAPSVDGVPHVQPGAAITCGVLGDLSRRPVVVTAGAGRMAGLLPRRFSVRQKSGLCAFRAAQTSRPLALKLAVGSRAGFSAQSGGRTTCAHALGMPIIACAACRPLSVSASQREPSGRVHPPPMHALIPCSRRSADRSVDPPACLLCYPVAAMPSLPVLALERSSNLFDCGCFAGCCALCVVFTG